MGVGLLYTVWDISLCDLITADCLLAILAGFILRHTGIDEGRAASKKSPHEKFGYFLYISQQAVSADITMNSAVSNIMQYLNHEY